MSKSRAKKTDTTTKKRNKKVDDDEIDEIDEDLIDDEIEEEEKKPKKSQKKPTTKTKKTLSSIKSTKKVDDDDEDYLSDLDVENEDGVPESNSQDELMPPKRQHKVIDPKSRLCDLKPDAILSHLIKVGTDELNPQLKMGALELLRSLTGRQTRSRPQYNGNSYNGGPKKYYNQNQRPFDPSQSQSGQSHSSSQSHRQFDSRGNGGNGRQRGGPRQTNPAPSSDIYNDD